MTIEYPWSVFANEAYYYIGQCHFKLGHWAKAIEALEMVGTSVPAETQGEAAAEAGQRLYVKVLDKNLVVLNTDKEKVKVLVAARSGDKEQVLLRPFGKSGEYWLGSIQTVLGEPAAGDGLLQISGGNEVTVSYVNRYTSEGKVNQQVLAKVKMVSTASVGFTDGAFREYTKGVIAEEPAFLRVKDMNRSVSKEPGRVSVRVFSRYKPHNDAKDKPAAQTKGQGPLGNPRHGRRRLDQDRLAQGIFTGSLTPHVPRADEPPAKAAGRLLAAKGDEIVVEYVNETSMVSRDPRTISASAKLLLGQFQDVKIEQRVVDLIDLKVRRTSSRPRSI